MQQPDHVILYDRRRRPSAPITLSCGPTSVRARRRIVESRDGTTGVRREQVPVPETIRIQPGGSSRPLPASVLRDPQVQALLRQNTLGYRKSNGGT